MASRKDEIKELLDEVTTSDLGTFVQEVAAYDDEFEEEERGKVTVNSGARTRLTDFIADKLESWGL